MIEYKATSWYKLTKVITETDHIIKVPTGRVYGQLIRVGQKVRVTCTGGGWWETSIVQEIERLGNGCIFYTENSEYLLEDLDYEQSEPPERKDNPRRSGETV